MEATVPEPQFVAAIDLLLTIGYIDGLLHEGEQAFIRHYLDQLVELQPNSRANVDEAYARLDAEISGIAGEVCAAGDDQYVKTKLKVRAVALFRSFSPADQKVALELFEAVSHADGDVSAHERDLHDELLAYFQARPSLPNPTQGALEGALAIEPAQPLPVQGYTHPALDAIEHPYASDGAMLLSQFHTDYNAIFNAIGVWEQQRALGNGRLMGVTDIGSLAPGTRLLDGHVHVLRPDHPTELIVLGDLHGCYGSLKGALMQTDFIERATRHQQDPANHPDVKLVLLGDYLDRGRFGFEGVMRAALQLLAMFPEHVVLLRGNHEYLVRLGEHHIVSGVNPAEAVPGIADKAPPGVLAAYRHLFEHMPTSLLVDRVMFVHGGIPRDDTFAMRYRDLSSLDDPVLRFEMLWSDPEQTDHVPLELQHASPRFSFGREQFRSFTERVGVHTLIRGHEQVDAGFVTTFDIGHRRLHTLFSSGGADNEDLPIESRYRQVTPMALTVWWDHGAMRARPWPIEYQPFVNATHNGLYR